MSVHAQRPAWFRRGGPAGARRRAARAVYDVRTIELAGLPAGAYRLVVGMYNRKTGRRYPASGPDGAVIPDGVVPAGMVRAP